jgi:hypothetical protein
MNDGWYQAVEPGSPLTQGDVIFDCFHVPPSLGGVDDRQGTESIGESLEASV